MTTTARVLNVQDFARIWKERGRSRKKMTEPFCLPNRFSLASSFSSLIHLMFPLPLTTATVTKRFSIPSHWITNSGPGGPPPAETGQKWLCENISKAHSTARQWWGCGWGKADEAQQGPSGKGGRDFATGQNLVAPPLPCSPHRPLPAVSPEAHSHRCL